VAETAGALHHLIGLSETIETYEQLLELAADETLDEARKREFAVAAAVLERRLIRAGVLTPPEEGK